MRIDQTSMRSKRPSAKSNAPFRPYAGAINAVALCATVLIAAQSPAAGRAIDGALAAQTSRPAQPIRPKSSNQVAQLTPLAIFIANGDDDACGVNCSEWIAAEGAFDQGSSARLRKFLDQLGGRKLPIFFDSPGGVVAQSLLIGRLLREREMTAGVAKTQSIECALISRSACDKLKRSGRPLKADLVTVRAQCNSACVYALAGAKVRQVLPGAHLGIHADKLVRIYNDGHMIAPTGAQLSPRERNRIAGDRRRLKSYIVEMGLSGELIDAATAISHESIHRLSPDEVARYGIDTRTFQETRWMISDVAGQRPAVLKYITEGKGAAAKEYRSSLLRLTCASPQTLRVDYVRGLASFEVGTATTVMIVSGERRYGLARVAIASGLTAEPTEVQSASVPFAFFETAQLADAIILTEADERFTADTAARTVRLSTGGLARALGALQPHCGA
jgi:hypothetical protein